MALFLVYLALPLVIAGLVFAVRAFIARRRVRVVHCPATAEVVTGRLDALHDPFGPSKAARIGSCSRWPAARHGAQGCLAEIEASPDGCVLQTIPRDWYRGRDCAYCCRRIAPLSWAG